MGEWVRVVPHQWGFVARVAGFVANVGREERVVGCEERVEQRGRRVVGRKCFGVDYPGFCRVAWNSWLPSLAPVYWHPQVANRTRNHRRLRRRIGSVAVVLVGREGLAVVARAEVVALAELVVPVAAQSVPSALVAGSALVYAVLVPARSLLLAYVAAFVRSGALASQIYPDPASHLGNP